jgi:hypothetical protein
MGLIREIMRAAYCEQEMPTAADQIDHRKLRAREEARLSEQEMPIAADQIDHRKLRAREEAKLKPI